MTLPIQGERYPESNQRLIDRSFPGGAGSGAPDSALAQAPETAPAERFTGKVQLISSFQAQSPGRVSGGTVTFAPDARTHWHTHPLGQTLVVTEGARRGKAAD